MQSSDGVVAGLGAALGAILIKLADAAAERWIARPDRIKALEDSLWQRASETIAKLDARIALLEARVAEQERELEARHREIMTLQEHACEVDPCEQRRRPGK